METIKIVPCLDMKDGRVVKGVNFENFKDAGDPAEIAAYYCAEGADELVFLDIAATVENRGLLLDVLRRTAEKVNIPLAVGGGLRTVADCEAVFTAGATKASVNSAAIKRPELINEMAAAFGSAKVIVAIDARRDSDDTFRVCINGGLTVTDIDAVLWAREAESRGAGAILLTSFDCDGTKQGYDIEMTRAISDAVTIPVTASGGAGTLEHIYNAVTAGGAKAALVASLFHFRELTIGQVKDYLAERGIPVIR